MICIPLLVSDHPCVTLPFQTTVNSWLFEVQSIYPLTSVSVFIFSSSHFCTNVWNLIFGFSVMCHFICFPKIWCLFFVKNIKKILFNRKMGKIMEFVVGERWSIPLWRIFHHFGEECLLKTCTLGHRIMDYRYSWSPYRAPSFLLGSGETVLVKISWGSLSPWRFLSFPSI